jgi:hypothetical protein
VTYIDTETDQEELIAGSFAEYIDQLTLDLDESFVLETERPLADVVQELQQLLETEWTETGMWAYGFPQYRTKWNESWIWISANEVSKGFARKDDDRYEELKAEMEGTALRYPELPPTALLLRVAEEAVREQLQRILADQGINLSLIAKFV